MDALRDYYAALVTAWGPQDWWPARSRFEVIVGAYLTQNTAWTNVERALRNLRGAGLLNVEGIREVPLRRLEKLVRPAGYFRQKAQRLKTFVRWLDRRYGGSLDRMFAGPTAELRAELLALNGVGPETADSILLYAGGHPVFVVDAYTRRVLARHGLLPENAPYEEVRSLFESTLAEFNAPTGVRMGFSGERRRHKFVVRRAAPAARIYDEYHALLVQTAKRHCAKPAPRCDGCPLQPFLPHPS
jgi:endonuclease-3 related protein